MKNRNYVYIALGIIILFGFILRIYSLNSAPMWVDETISSLAAKNILEKGVPVFDSGIVYNRAYIFHYLTALSIALFGLDFGARMPSLFFGLGTIALTFFIASEFSYRKGEKNYTAGLIAALFTATIFIEVAYSRQARFYQMFQFLLFLTLFFIYKARTNKKYAWLASIAFVFLVDTQIAGIILLPFLLYVFIFENKDWKLLIIPILTTIIFLPSVFGVTNNVSSDLLSRYFENYSSGIFSYLRAFAIISLIGTIPAAKWNSRLSFFLVIPSTLLLVGILSQKLFALRYLYFIILLAPIFMGIFFSYIWKENKTLFVIITILALIYPSNLIFPYGITMIKPTQIVFASSTEPIIEYNLLSQSTKTKIKNAEVVTLFTPGVEVYFKKPEYFIPFSLNGLDESLQIDQRDIYTNAKVFNNQVSNFVIIQDYFGYSKLSNAQREKLDAITKNCATLESLNTLIVYECNSP